MNFANFRRWGAILTLSTLGLATGLTAETGTVSADNSNVRGRAGFIGEVVTRLKKGDTVTILEDVKIDKPKPGEPANWLKIALPANTPVWLHSAYVDAATQTIKASKLKVRGGPGINFSVLGFLEKGTPIKEIRRSGEWIEIEPPAGLGAYIAADLVTRQAAAQPTEAASNIAKPANETPTTVADTSKPETETPTNSEAKKSETPPETTTPAVEQPKTAETTTELPKGADIGKPGGDEKPATPPAEQAGNPAVTTPAPPTTSIVAEPAQPITTPPTNTDRTLTTEERAMQALEQRTRDSQHWEVPLEQDDPLLKSLPVHRREVVRDGKIRRAMSIQAPGDYILEHVETGLRLDYLYTSSTNIPLKELLGVKVRVKGEEAIDQRWPGTPVLLIQSLEVLP